MKEIYFYLLSSMSIFSLIVDAPTLAETSQPTISLEQLPTANTQIEATTLALQKATPTLITQLDTTTEPIDEVPSVNQLSDVQPSDWAYQALQSLIERYGVVTGYPDRTYRGNKAITRYEFAASLNVVLERVNELITNGLATQGFRDDPATLQRLRREFASELASVRSRLDNLEARAAQLEANQFSTTTKLTGQVIFAPNAGGFSGKRIVDSTGAEVTNHQPSATFIDRASLDLNTSFFGTDLLKLRLDAVSGRGRDSAAGFLEPNLGSVPEFTVRGTPSSDFGISRLYYSFSPSQDLNVTLGPEIVSTDYIDTNSYANGNGIDFITLALVNNYLLFPVNGPSAGAVLQWHPGQGPFKVKALYAAADAANPISNSQAVVSGLFPFVRLLYPNGGGNRGLFGDPYQGTVELEYSSSKAFALRLQYSGGYVFNGRFDVVGANVEFALSRQLGIFGRYGYGSYSNTAFGDINPNYWMAGLSVRDLLVPGAVAGIAAGQPFIESAVGNATQTNLEAFYNFPLSDNIQITPLLQVITNPANQNANGTIFTGTLRTVFSF